MHDLGQAELDAIAEVLSGPILTTGEWVARFEQRFAEYLGVSQAIAVTSCTGALHLSLLALGIGPGHEVITTPMTFIATAASIVQTGARRAKIVSLVLSVAIADGHPTEPLSYEGYERTQPQSGKAGPTIPATS